MIKQPISLALMVAIAFGLFVTIRRSWRFQVGHVSKAPATIVELVFTATISAIALYLLFSLMELPVSSRLFPRLVLWVVLIASIASFVLAVKRRIEMPFGPSGLKLVPIFSAFVTALYILLIPYFGYFTSSFVFL
ncbi:hypothetical protein [Roseibium sp. SCP14]|uniref:hypothetical protein n=1 Tax=Roseibium sp. SCP14 TaxID=3141375 RepID=UPI003334BD98